jgi:hypothetical protein
MASESGMIERLKNSERRITNYEFRVLNDQGALLATAPVLCRGPFAVGALPLRCTQGRPPAPLLSKNRAVGTPRLQ